MDLRRLSFDSMPPLAIPFRFFVTAPVFAILVALLFLVAEPFELSSRWTNLLLAATHGITLGFMLMIMVGALFQILPVVTGVSMPKVKHISTLVHLFFSAGVFSLIAGLYSMSHYLLMIAGATLGVGFSAFFIGLISCMSAMRNTPSSWAVRLAVLSLMITISFGLLFIFGWDHPSWFPNPRAFTNTHLLWGLIGWTLLLIMGVSFQIIPMFYVTPDYPTWLSRFLPPVIFLELITVSVSQGHTIFGLASLILLTLTSSIYPAYTLHLISKRKRKSQDITLWFWKTSMISFLIAALTFLWLIFYNGGYLARLELILAATVLFGFIMALITGMLLKIVPFLVWLNLQQSWIKNPSVKMPLSNMQQVIPAPLAKLQYFLFMLMFALILILMSGFQTYWLLKLTALTMLANFGYLLYNLIKAKALYKQLARELDTAKI